LKERNIEGLRKQLAQQETKCRRLLVPWEQAMTERQKTLEALKALGAEMLPGMEPEPAQDTPHGDGTATIAPATESVGAETSETPIADARAGARERVVVRRAGRLTTICPHGKVEGWCSKCPGGNA